MKQLSVIASIAILVFTTQPAQGAFVSAVVSYTSGTVPTAHTNPAAAVGMPAGDTSFGVLTPFNSAFLDSHIVGIGPGGNLTLQLEQTAPTGQGSTLAIHAAVGMIDDDWPNGLINGPAELFTNPRTAELLVSENGSDFVSLGTQTFQIPTNFYSKGITTPGYQETPGTQVADFTKPFVHVLSDFDNLNWAQTLALLDGSAGGQWIDLTNVPLAGVNFVRFVVTTPGAAMYVDAVASIPEPQSLFGLAAIILAARRVR